MFEGVKSGAICLGAPCFDFPPEATEALIGFTQGDYAELFISPRPNDDRDFFQARYRPGKFSNYYTWLVRKGAGS